MGGPHGQSGPVRKISLPSTFDPRIVQSVASRYTDYAIPAHKINTNSFVWLGGLEVIIFRRWSQCRLLPTADGSTLRNRNFNLASTQKDKPNRQTSRYPDKQAMLCLDTWRPRVQETLPVCGRFLKTDDNKTSFHTIPPAPSWLSRLHSSDTPVLYSTPVFHSCTRHSSSLPAFTCTQF